MQTFMNIVIRQKNISSIGRHNIQYACNVLLRKQHISQNTLAITLPFFALAWLMLSLKHDKKNLLFFSFQFDVDQ